MTVGSTPIKRVYLSLYLFVTAVYLQAASGRIGFSDGFAMLNVAQSVVNVGSLSQNLVTRNSPAIRTTVFPALTAGTTQHSDWFGRCWPRRQYFSESGPRRFST